MLRFKELTEATSSGWTQAYWESVSNLNAAVRNMGRAYQKARKENPDAADKINSLLRKIESVSSSANRPGSLGININVKPTKPK